MWKPSSSLVLIATDLFSAHSPGHSSLGLKLTTILTVRAIRQPKRRVDTCYPITWQVREEDPFKAVHEYTEFLSTLIFKTSLS